MLSPGIRIPAWQEEIREHAPPSSLAWLDPENPVEEAIVKISLRHEFFQETD